MQLRQNFIDALNQAEDEFDIIAACYRELLAYKEDDDNGFITRVGHLSKDPQYGAYGELFASLRQRVVEIAEEMNTSDVSAGISFEKFQERLISEVTQFQCPNELTENDCMPVCIFYILDGLDGYIEKNQQFVYGTCKSYGPLNKGADSDRFLVYLQERTSFLSGAYDEKAGFRKPQRATRIGSIFRMFLLFEKHKWPCIPQIKPILLNSRCEKTIFEEKKLVISDIPYIGFQTFQMQSIEQSQPCEPKDIEGEFYIKYCIEWDDDNIQRILALLDLAIDQGSHIIVFPEFIMSEPMLKAIQDHLGELENGKRNQLLLVLAGTHYDWDEGKRRGNNVLHILNANGTDIGVYYKYSPFRVQSEERMHGADLQKKDSSPVISSRKYYKCCEILSDKGKECTLIDIEYIGRVLPAVCRDVIDGEYTLNLANAFLPSLLLIPAWSKSVYSFDTKLESIAKDIHTTSLLCNCCDAVAAGKKTIGRFCMPVKQKTRMKAPPLPISRETGCKKLCKNRNGCIKQIEVDFSCGQPKSRVVGTYYPE